MPPDSQQSQINHSPDASSVEEQPKPKLPNPKIISEKGKLGIVLGGLGLVVVIILLAAFL